MKKKSGLNKESYVACLIIGVTALLCLFPFWVALVNSFASETSVTLNGYSLFRKNSAWMDTNTFGKTKVSCSCGPSAFPSWW